VLIRSSMGGYDDRPLRETSSCPAATAITPGQVPL
jgi:hypothetical protein